MLNRDKNVKNTALLTTQKKKCRFRSMFFFLEVKNSKSSGHLGRESTCSKTSSKYQRETIGNFFVITIWKSGTNIKFTDLVIIFSLRRPSDPLGPLNAFEFFDVGRVLRTIY